MIDFAGSHVVVTGGTGALGRAVIGRLRAAGAICHVPNLVAAELDAFPYKSDSGVYIVRDVDLADEAAVTRFYGTLPPLWASIHLAGGFAMAPVGEISAADFVAQFRINALSCFLCSAAAVAAIRARRQPGPGGAKGGRIVNVAARPALEPRLESGGGGAHSGAGAGARRRGNLGQCGRPFGHRHPGQSTGDAAGRSFPLGRPRRSRRNHRVSRFPGQSRNARRRPPGLRPGLSPAPARRAGFRCGWCPVAAGAAPVKEKFPALRHFILQPIPLPHTFGYCNAAKAVYLWGDDAFQESVR
jgi:hypothetical protein